jgi:hypothetical protein
LDVQFVFSLSPGSSLRWLLCPSGMPHSLLFPSYFVYFAHFCLLTGKRHSGPSCPFYDPPKLQPLRVTTSPSTELHQTLAKKIGGGRGTKRGSQDRRGTFQDTSVFVLLMELCRNSMCELVCFFLTTRGVHLNLFWEVAWHREKCRVLK